MALHFNYQDRYNIHVAVGWAFPETDDELFINVHILYDMMDWTDVVDYKLLQDLKKSVNNHTEEFRYVSFPALSAGEIMDTIQMLWETEYNSDNIKQLEKMAKTMAVWIESVLSAVGRLDDESRRICKQLFFRSVAKLEKYATLATRSATGERKLSNESYDPNHGPQKKRGSVFQTVSRAFGTGKKEGRLNEANLERINGMGNENSSEYEPSEAGTLFKASQSQTSPKAPMNRRASAAIKGMFSSRRSDNGVSNGHDIDEPSRASIAAPSALEIAEKSTLLRVEVQRGQETQQSVVTYDIILKVVGKKQKNPMQYTTAQRFSHFKRLNQQLIEINNRVLSADAGSGIVQKKSTDFMLMFTVNFPALPMKSYLGLSLNDSELSERTRALDAWFRDVCLLYRHMPSDARQAVRHFLNFEMSQAKDIFFQDQLAWGIIERNETNARPMLLVQRSVLNTVSDSMKSDLEETLSAVDGHNNSNGSNSPKGPRRPTSLPSTSVIASSSSGSGNGIQRSIQKGPSKAPATRGSVFRFPTSRLDETSSEVGDDKDSQLHNLLWETASMGGTSKIHKKKAQQSRTILKKIDE